MFASVGRSVSKNKTSSGRRNQESVTHLTPLVLSDVCPCDSLMEAVLACAHLLTRTSVSLPALLSIAPGFVLGIPMWILTCFHGYLTPGLASCTRLTYFILPVLSTPPGRPELFPVLPFCLVDYRLHYSWNLHYFSRQPFCCGSFNCTSLYHPQASPQTFKAESLPHQRTVKISALPVPSPPWHVCREPSYLRSGRNSSSIIKHNT